MKECVYCGKMNADDAMNCKRCKAALETAEAPEEGATAKKPKGKKQEKE